MAMALPDAPSSAETALNVEKLAALNDCERFSDSRKEGAARIAVRCAFALASAILSGLLAVAKAIERRK